MLLGAQGLLHVITPKRAGIVISIEPKVDFPLTMVIGSICTEFLRKVGKENPNTHPIFIIPTVGKDMGSFRTNITATSPSIFVLYGYS